MTAVTATTDAPQATILIVDDERLIRWSLAERLSAEGHRTIEVESGREALDHFGAAVDLVLLDYRLGDVDGLQVLKALRQREPDVLVIFFTAFSSLGNAVEVMKQGAYHYATKPFDLDEIALLVEKALETTRLRREVRALRARQQGPYSLDRFIGGSPAAAATRELLGKVAASPASTVLLTGESGTGKDLAARVIHDTSARATRPFMNVTCSALTGTLLESELFGHERGAFTDARERKRGLLESAAGGTVFLDEIGEMAPALQAKLLRFLEEKTFKRVGGAEDVQVDVRVVAATNRSLEADVRDGSFREDLFYRLNVLPVRLPPLRDRADDVPVLARFFADGFSREFRKRVREIAPEALEALQRYTWPGNVRELRNAVERAVLLAAHDRLTVDDFPLHAPRERVAAAVALPPGGTNLAALERSLVAQALDRTGWNRTRAAALLGLSRDQIRYRMEKFGLTK